MQTSNESRTSIWGEEYIRTTDGHGNLLQISKRKDYAVGGVVYETTDAQGNYLGYSKPKEDAFGNRAIETYDQSGRLIRTSYEHFDYMGNSYWTIENDKGDVVGHHQNGKTNYYEKEKHTSEGGGSSAPAGAAGGSLGLIFSLVLFFLIAVLFGMLHDPSGREKVHRFVTPCIGIVPIAVILIRSLKVKDILSPFKNTVLIQSCVLMLIMQAYYIFYTARSMSWMVDTDTILYYVLWLLPYLFLYAYCWLCARQALKARKTAPRDEIKRVLNTIYEPTCFLYCFCPSLMVLRWEFYNNDGMYGRTIVEILTILFLVFAGLGLGILGEKIFEKVTRKAFL